MDVQIFVQNIKNHCKRVGVSPTSACKNAGVGASFISDINRGQTPSVAKVQLLAEYLGVTTSKLLGEKEAESDPLSETSPASKAALQAAFWGGEKDLSQEDLDDMWSDVERFAQFLADKKKQEKQAND